MHYVCHTHPTIFDFMILSMYEEKRKKFVCPSYSILHYNLIPHFISVSFNFQFSQTILPSLYVNISIQKHMLENGGFGGLEIACWPSVPKFASSNPALSRLIFQHASFKEGKYSRLSHVAYLRHVKEPESVFVEVAAFGRNYRSFLAK